MSGYKDLFNINTLTDLESMNVNEGTINSLTSVTINADESTISNGTFQSLTSQALYSGTITSENCNVNKNLNFHSNSSISKGEYKYTLQDKTGVIAHLNDIKTPENMVTTNTVQTIYALKTFNDGIRVKKRFGLVLGDDDTKTVTIGVSTPDANRIHSIPVTPSNDTFLMSYLTQDINGIKTFKKDINLEKNINIGTSSLINIGTSSSVSFQDKSGIISLKSDLDDYVTKNLDETITGNKTFSSETTINNYLNLDGFRLKGGKFTFNNMTIYEPLQSGGLVVWGDMIDYLTLKNVNQTVLGEKTFNSRVKFMNGFNNGLYNIDMPNKSGVISLTSDLNDYVTLNNVNQTINGIKTFSNLVMFQNNISNGVYNYTFTGKSGRLLIDDDFNTLNSIVGIIKDDVTVLQDDIKLIKDDTKIINNDIILIKDDVTTLKTDVGVINNDIVLIKDDVTTLKTDVIVVKDDVKTIQDNMAVKDDLKNLVTLDTNQDITAVKSFENTVYFNSGVYVKLDKRLQTGSFKCINDAAIDGVATINDLVVNNTMKYGDVFQSSNGNTRYVHKYYNVSASNTKYITLRFINSSWWSFYAKLNIYGWANNNTLQYFMNDYNLISSRENNATNKHEEKLINSFSNNTVAPSFEFYSLNANSTVYKLLTNASSSITTMVCVLEVSYTSAYGVLDAGFETILT